MALRMLLVMMMIMVMLVFAMNCMCPSVGHMPSTKEEGHDYKKVKAKTSETAYKAWERAKEAIESWTKWANKEKLNEGLGLKNDEDHKDSTIEKAKEYASDAEQKTKDYAEKAKEKGKEGYDASKDTIASNLETEHVQHKLGAQHRNAEL